MAIDSRKKWFVEEALHENPTEIDEREVTTMPIQDGSNGSNSTTSSTSTK
jgi:hypothetical protein